MEVHFNWTTFSVFSLNGEHLDFFGETEIKTNDQIGGSGFYAR